MARKHISDRQVCRAVQAYQDAIKALGPVPLGYVFGAFPCASKSLPLFPHEALAVETGQPEKVCYRALERACDRGLIEYGTSLRTGWLTKAGLDLLEEG